MMHLTIGGTSDLMKRGNFISTRCLCSSSLSDRCTVSLPHGRWSSSTSVEFPHEYKMHPPSSDWRIPQDRDYFLFLGRGGSLKAGAEPLPSAGEPPKEEDLAPFVSCLCWGLGVGTPSIMIIIWLINWHPLVVGPLWVGVTSAADCLASWMCPTPLTPAQGYSPGDVNSSSQRQLKG